MDQPQSIDRSRRRRRGLGAMSGVALVILAAAIALSSGGGAPRTAAPPPPASGTAPQVASLLDGIPQRGITLGKPGAPVTLVEFADLQCPYCREYTLNTLPTLIARYVRTGKVQMLFRNLTFLGPGSLSAGRYAAAAAEQNRLWDFIDLFYANQGTENSGYVDGPFLQRIAAGAGLDVSGAVRAAARPAAQAPLSAAAALARQAGIDSTPSFLVGRTGGSLHRFDPANLTPADFTPAIDALLKA
ncbi:MAG: hypothetical protein NVSMB51_10330 [Solirubrobacteraceae bacterium]